MSVSRRPSSAAEYHGAMPQPGTDSRTRLSRHPERGAHDRASIDAILDAGVVCHVGFVHEGSPVVVPTLYARIGDAVFFHGSPASRMLQTLSGGCEVALTVTSLDGLALARAAFNLSVNYRSVMVFGQTRPVEDHGEKLAALEAFSEHVMPGRWADIRPPNAREVNATTVLALPLDVASAKVRSGPVVDDEEDSAPTVWAGVVPLHLQAGRPETDARVAPGVEVPVYVQDYARSRYAAANEAATEADKEHGGASSDSVSGEPDRIPDS